jgi:hypothetical protein
MVKGADRLHALHALWPIVTVLLVFAGAAWAHAHGLVADASAKPAAAPAQPAAPLAPAVQRELVWSGADVDGDGQADFANPTGKPVRTCDDYGCGAFGSRRDHGGRRHEGVDFDAKAGQSVGAPISGFISKIGEAYADDGRYRFVEITNPALHYVARVFYVRPEVAEGQAVRLGQPIGVARSLQPRYPGITNHVHLELARLRGRRIDCTRLITERWEDAPRAAGVAQAPANAGRG